MVKIAVIGEAGSGKDFIAEMLVDYFGFKRFAFADEIRTIAARYFPDEYGDESRKNRQLLIDIGEGFRAINPMVWVDELMRQINDSDSELIVVTDTRRPNEYARLRSEGFVFIRIQTTVQTRNDRIVARGDVVQPGVLNHETESHYDSFDCEYEIDNNHNEKILAYASVANILEEAFGILPE